jgi:hypothetical protein
MRLLFTINGMPAGRPLNSPPRVNDVHVAWAGGQGGWIEIVAKIATVAFAVAGLLSTPVTMLTTSAFAQAHVYNFCASADELRNKHHEPIPTYADGNGDGTANDYLMQRISLKNTVLEEWCINGGSDGGYYIAWKIDGMGKPFKFIAKCSWDRGQNWISRISRANGVLNGPLIIVSKDPETGRYWTYTYYPDLGSVVAQKHEADGTNIPPGASFYPKEEPFSYRDLLGGSDPTFCVDVTRMRRSVIRRLPK